MTIHLYGLTQKEFDVVRPRIILALKSVKCHGVKSDMSAAALIIWHNCDKDVVVNCGNRPFKFIQIVDLSQDYLNKVIYAFVKFKIYLKVCPILSYEHEANSWGAVDELPKELLGYINKD